MSSEFAVWNILHDGCIVDVEGLVPGDVTVAVEIEYLGPMLPDPEDRFLVRLSDCTMFELRRFLPDQTLVSDFTTVASEEPEILSALRHDNTVVVSMTRGAGPYMELHLRYDGISISLQNGRPVSAEELDDAVRRYWEHFDKTR